MNKILLIDHFDSFSYNLKALFELNGFTVDTITNNEYIVADDYQALIFSPGPSNPSNAGSSLKYFKEYQGKLPIFGVCLGMQVIGHMLGYPVVQANKIMHGKRDEVIIEENSALLKGFEGNRCTMVRYHSLIVQASEEITTSRAVTDNAIMSIEIPDKGLYGVQFHPESYLSEQGNLIVNNFKGILEEWRN